MTPLEFQTWLADMRSAGLASSDAACARLLGRSVQGLILLKKKGGDKAMALACAALLAGMGPYGSVRWQSDIE